uniref:EF-hand domain-containing protein n=1 Tax=Meloidogyne enterolobii TaxID=390850 RepID=A0A6V7VWK6_MELEN|nr:unnamed protein product [Meloidogyne enterolobii]
MIKHIVTTAKAVVLICLTLTEGRVIWPVREQSEVSPSYYGGKTAKNPFELFKIIDVDDDGQLGLEEAADWFSQLKNQTKDDTLGDVEFRMLFKEADANSDGFIQFEELDKALKLAFKNEFESDESDEEDEHKDVEERKDSHVSEMKPSSDESAISKPTKLFEIIDSDNDGKITFVEASEWFSKMKNQSMDFTSDDKEFRNLFKATDKNSDGFIQPEELIYVEVLARALAANFLPNKNSIQAIAMEQAPAIETPQNQPKELTPLYYDVKKLFKIIDVNMDAKISFEEAADWFSKVKNETKSDALGDLEFNLLFTEADKNHDGFIEFEEMDNALKLVFENDTGESNEDDSDAEENVSDSKEAVSDTKKVSDNKETVSDTEENVSDNKENVSDKKENVSDNKENEDVYDNKESVSDNKDKVSDKNETVSEGNVSDNKENVSDNKQPVSDNKDNVSDNKENVSDTKNITESKENVSDDKETESDSKENVSDNKENIIDSKDSISDNKDGVSTNDNVSSVAKSVQESKEKIATENLNTDDKIERKENDELKEKSTTDVNKNTDSIVKENASVEKDNLNTPTISKEKDVNDTVPLNAAADNIENATNNEPVKEDKSKENAIENINKDTVVVNEVKEDGEIHDNDKDSTEKSKDNASAIEDDGDKTVEVVKSTEKNNAEEIQKNEDNASTIEDDGDKTVEVKESIEKASDEEIHKDNSSSKEKEGVTDAKETTEKDNVESTTSDNVLATDKATENGPNDDKSVGKDLNEEIAEKNVADKSENKEKADSVVDGTDGKNKDENKGNAIHDSSSTSKNSGSAEGKEDDSLMINIWLISEDKENIAETKENASNSVNETDYKKEDEKNDNAIHDSSSMFKDFGSAEEDKENDADTKENASNDDAVLENGKKDEVSN